MLVRKSRLLSPLRFGALNSVGRFLIGGVVVFLVGCSSTSGIKKISTTPINGKISGLYATTLPVDAKLHLLVQQREGGTRNEKILAEQTLEIPRTSSTQSFHFNVPTAAISTEDDYAILACVTVQGRLRMLSRSGVPVLTKGHGDTAEVLVEPVWQQGEVANLAGWIAQDETALQNSIQTNLAGICLSATPDYDKLVTLKASTLLPAEMLSGENFEVSEQVSFRGPDYFFMVETDFGTFTVQGLAMLRRLIGEINALETMQNFQNTDKFKEAFSETTLAPFGEFKAFILNPLDRIKGALKGTGTVIQSTGAALTQKRSEYEDRYLESLVGVSKYKRKYAGQMGIDVYTGNGEVQKELNRIGWAASLGSWAPVAVLFPYSGVYKLTYAALSWQETLNRLVVEESPDSLRFRNINILKKMGVAEPLITQFLSHPTYTPRHHTVIASALESLNGVTGVELFLQEAVNASTDIDALSFQQLAELLAGYHEKRAPVEQIVLHHGIPAGITKDKDLIMLLPIDLARWTPFSESIFNDSGEEPSPDRIARKTLWLTGTATEKFRHNMDRLGIELVENVDQIITLMD